MKREKLLIDFLTFKHSDFPSIPLGNKKPLARKKGGKPL